MIDTNGSGEASRQAEQRRDMNAMRTRDEIKMIAAMFAFKISKAGSKASLEALVAIRDVLHPALDALYGPRQASSMQEEEK